MTRVDLVITDLDNTLYDWVSSFVPAFGAMVAVACDILGVEEEALLDELRQVHQLHGSSEHPFALLETPSTEAALAGLSNAERRQALDSAFHAFNSARKRSLHLYPTVRETLERLRELGTPVVAHTDARFANSLFRILKLELVPLLGQLYAPRHRTDALNVPFNAAEIPEGFVALLPPEDRKPNPKTVLDICRRYGIAPAHTLYVGDSVSRDIVMGNAAGARTAWAKYGTEVDSGHWANLVRVSHWTQADVEREERLRRDALEVTPDVTLDAFGELLAHFSFGRSANASAI